MDLKQLEAIEKFINGTLKIKLNNNYTSNKIKSEVKYGIIYGLMGAFFGWWLCKNYVLHYDGVYPEGTLIVAFGILDKAINWTIDIINKLGGIAAILPVLWFFYKVFYHKGRSTDESQEKKDGSK